MPGAAVGQRFEPQGLVGRLPARDLCRIISRDYLPGMTPEAVAELAEMMSDDP